MNTQIETYRYVIHHNHAVLYFIQGADGEYLVTLNPNGTAGCQHNGVSECPMACPHVEQAKILEMQEQQALQQKSYSAKTGQQPRAMDIAPLNGNKGFSLLR